MSLHVSAREYANPKFEAWLKHLPFCQSYRWSSEQPAHWTFSICSVFTLVWGSQMAAAYSSCGRTRVLRAASLTPDIFVLTFLFMRPRVLFAELVILSTCEPHDRLLVMSTPRYLAQLTVLRISPCSRYKLALMGFLEPVTCTT